MRWLAILLLQPLSAAADQDKEKPPPPARVTVNAELACLHCTFGGGEQCAVCLKLDAKTPLVLTGKAVKEFEDARLEKKLLVATGTLARDKDKRLVLATENAALFADVKEKDKDKAPAAGQARVEGTP